MRNGLVMIEFMPLINDIYMIYIYVVIKGLQRGIKRCHIFKDIPGPAEDNSPKTNSYNMIRENRCLIMTPTFKTIFGILRILCLL